MQPRFKPVDHGLHLLAIDLSRQLTLAASNTPCTT
jgi:hypothetical protein